MTSSACRAATRSRGASSRTGLDAETAAAAAASRLAALLRATAGGDHAAFAALYDLAAPQLFGVALRILRQRDRAEDVLQESFVAVWQHAQDYDPAKGAVMTWLITI